MKLVRMRRTALGVAAITALLAAATRGLRAESPTVTAWNILNTATSDTNLQKRAQSVSALGLIPKNTHAEELAAKALSDDKPDVRAAAANALGQMGATASIPALTAALKDTDVSVVLAAAHSLLLLKDKVSYEVYYAVLTGERKSGAGLLADQKKMLNDPKKMAQFGFETGVGFIPLEASVSRR